MKKNFSPVFIILVAFWLNLTACEHSANSEESIYPEKVAFSPLLFPVSYSTGEMSIAFVFYPDKVTYFPQTDEYLAVVVGDEGDRLIKDYPDLVTKESLVLIPNYGLVEYSSKITDFTSDILYFRNEGVYKIYYWMGKEGYFKKVTGFAVTVVDRYKISRVVEVYERPPLEMFPQSRWSMVSIRGGIFGNGVTSFAISPDREVTGALTQVFVDSESLSTGKWINNSNLIFCTQSSVISQNCFIEGEEWISGMPGSNGQIIAKKSNEGIEIRYIFVTDKNELVLFTFYKEKGGAISYEKKILDSSVVEVGATYTGPATGSSFLRYFYYVTGGDRKKIKVLNWDFDSPDYFEVTMPVVKFLTGYFDGEGNDFNTICYLNDMAQVVCVKPNIAFALKFNDNFYPYMDSPMPVDGYYFMRSSSKKIYFGLNVSYRIWSELEIEPDVLEGRGYYVYLKPYDMNNEPYVTVIEDKLCCSTLVKMTEGSFMLTDEEFSWLRGDFFRDYQDESRIYYSNGFLFRYGSSALVGEAITFLSPVITLNVKIGKVNILFLK